MTIVKNSKIVVKVEEALADLLVVSYCDNDRTFQGVLLDSTKGNLPYGVYGLHPAFVRQPEPAEIADEKLYSASQRYAYQETQYAKKSAPRTKNSSKQKMTVRLRPRKVLCSNCQGICNENNENVDVSLERKSRESRVVNISATSSISSGRRTLIPKLSRLKPSEIEEALDRRQPEIQRSEVWIKEAPLSDDEVVEVAAPPDAKEPEPASLISALPPRTVKICFGEGEDRVVTIPEGKAKGEKKSKRKTKKSETLSIDERKKRKRKRKHKTEVDDILENGEERRELSISLQRIGNETDPFEIYPKEERFNMRDRRRSDHLKSPTQ